MYSKNIKKIANDIMKEAVIRRCQPKDITDDRPKSEQQWCLYTKDKKRLLGRHPSKEKAEKQERAVQYFKHKSTSQEALPIDYNLNQFNEF